MRLAQKGIRPQADRSPMIMRSDRSNGISEDKTEVLYKEEVRKLEERIRKSEIEKAELDLKLSQVDYKENFSGKDSVYVTKLLYQENRELKKQIKGFQEELSLFRIERGKHKLSEVKTSVSPGKVRNNPDSLYREKYLQLKSVLNRQKVKNLKKVAALQMVNFIKNLVVTRKNYFFKVRFIKSHKNLDRVVEDKVKKIHQKLKKDLFTRWKTIFTLKKKSLKKIFIQVKKNYQQQSIKVWKTQNIYQKFGTVLNSLKKTLLYYHRIGELCKCFSKLKDNLSKSKLAENKLRINTLNLQLSKTLVKRTENKNLQLQLITVIFIKNIRRVLLNSLRNVTNNISQHSKNAALKSQVLRNIILKKIKFQVLFKFNLWKHSAYNLAITDLCKLYEEQKVEKEFLMEQFDIIRMEDSELISSKFKVSALKSLSILRGNNQKHLVKHFFSSWARLAEISKSKIKGFKSFIDKFEWVVKKRQILGLFQLVHFEKPQKKQTQMRVIEKIVRKNMIDLKKVFNLLEFNRQRVKLIRKYLEKLVKQKKFKAKLNYFRRFYQNTKLGLLKIMKDESLLMTQNNKFLEQSLNTANLVIQDSSLILSAFEKRMQNKSLRLALGFSIENTKEMLSKFFKTWKECLWYCKNYKKALKKLEFLINTPKFTMLKKFILWKFNSKPQIKTQSPYTILKLVNYKMKAALFESFNSWKVFKGYSELYEAIEHEKFNNLLCRVTNILLKCKKIKVQSTFALWLQKVKKCYNKGLIISKLIRALTIKAKKQLKKSFYCILSLSPRNISGTSLDRFIRSLKQIRKFQMFSVFCQLKQGTFQKKAAEYKKDCEILLNLAECSEKLLEDKDKDFVKETNRTSHYKKALKKFVLGKRPKIAKEKCFKTWKKSFYDKKLSLENYFSVFKRFLNRKVFYAFKNRRTLISMSNLFAIESPEQNKIPQESVEFDISDPSILHFNYKKLTPSFSVPERPLKPLKFLVLIKYKSTISFTFNKWKSSSALNNSKNLNVSSNSSQDYTKAYFSLTLLINSYQKLSNQLEFSFKLWKTMFLSPSKASQIKKKPDQEQLIKKLLQENMTMAFKLSNAKVASKNFVKLTNDLCQNDKENHPGFKLNH